MWRSSCKLLRQSVASSARTNPSRYQGCLAPSAPFLSSFSASSAEEKGGDLNISYSEAKKVIGMMNVEALKMKLGVEGKDAIGSKVRELDSQVVGDQVYLQQPDKLFNMVRRAARPLNLTPRDDLSREELKKLQEKKKELDVLSEKQINLILSSGLKLVGMEGKIGLQAGESNGVAKSSVKAGTSGHGPDEEQGSPPDSEGYKMKQNILRPLSPHLPIYKPQSNSVSSISHRIAYVYLVLLGVTFYLLYLGMGTIGLTYYSFYQFLFYSSYLIPISLDLAAVAMAYHVYHEVSHFWAYRGLGRK